MYSPIITHDIDRYYKWKKPIALLGELNRIAIGKSSWTVSECIGSFLRKSEDPFSNIEEIAALDAKMGLKSVFYIMTTKEEHIKNINDYDPSKIKKELGFVISTGAEIGLHPGILSYNSIDKLQEQKSRLEDIVQIQIKRSRQHYLKYESPVTFRYLEQIGIENDSSIYPTQKWTTYNMPESSITQTPLVFMDTHHMHKKDTEILEILEDSLKPAKKHGGEVMVLWHNNNISNNRELGLYREALQIIKNK